MAERLRVFLFVLTATRFGSDGKPGRKLVLAYSSAPNVDDAMDHAQSEIAALGWHEVELQRINEVTSDPSLEPDAIAREAISRALTEGFAQISY